MLKEDILKFIIDNQDEKLMDFYNKTYEKLKDLNRKIDRLTLFLGIIVLLYLVASKATIASFSIGPVSLSDISLIVKLLPILFAALLLDLAITSGHKAELQTTVKFIFLSLYKQEVDPKDLEDGKLNLFSRIIMPFSYSSELLKFSSSKVSILSGCFGTILFVPLLSFILLPFYFEFYMLREIYLNHYNSTVGKISFYLSIWLMLTVIYYYLNTTILAFRYQKAGKI
jgi:hypothetical protein